MRRTAEFVKNLKFENLEKDVIQKAKECLLDFMGAILGGAKTKAGEISLKVVRGFGGPEEATIWPTGEKVPCQSAAFVHGTMGTVLDIDDGHRIARGHPGGAMISGALAIAEKNKNTGKEVLEALVCGYEVGIRVGQILRAQNPQLKSLGSGRWGGMGAAIAVAKLQHFKLEQIEQAFAVSATFAPVAPILEDLEKNGFVPMTKFSSGWGALMGIWSAQLAQGGFTGVSSTIDFSLSILPGYGESFEIKNVYFKPYPSCRWTHPAIEGTIQLMKEHPDLNKDNIKSISIKTFSAACRLKEPHPKTMESAQYSIPFVVGAVVVDKEVGTKQIAEERLSDPDILNIADKVEVIHASEFDDCFPKTAPSEVEIKTTSGQCYRTTVTRPKGDTKNPMSDQELVEKFKRLATRSISLEAAESVKEAVKKLEDIPDLTELVQLFRR